MAIPLKKYRIRKNKMERGCISGFKDGTNRELLFDETQAVHILKPERLDSAVPSCIWGRMVMDAELPADSVLTIHAYASDEDLFDMSLCDKFINSKDVLLYRQRGRYLWVWVEVSGRGSGWIKEIQVYTPGDNFMNTFPEIYREHGSFLHRYLSIFSSIYMDFQQRIDAMHSYIDLDTAPAQVLLVIADWLGIRIETSMLDEEILRALLREAGYLNRYKGTCKAVEKIARLILKCDVILLERSALAGSQDVLDRRIYNQLYGTGSHDFTIMVKGEYSELGRSQLCYLLDQFKPARSRMNLVYLHDSCCLDGYCYLDQNAVIHQSLKGVLDHKIAMDGSGYMSE